MHPVLGRPMLDHCFERAKFFPRCDALLIATCDEEIETFGADKDYPVIMTSNTHTRALDPVAEAAENVASRWMTWSSAFKGMSFR